MKLLSRIAAQVGFAGLILLGFLLAFESYLDIPTWLQPLGRMHPLLLHLPIGVLALLAVVPLVRKEIGEESYLKVRSFILDIGLIATKSNAQGIIRLPIVSSGSNGVSSILASLALHPVFIDEFLPKACSRELALLHGYRDSPGKLLLDRFQ